MYSAMPEIQRGRRAVNRAAQRGPLCGLAENIPTIIPTPKTNTYVICWIFPIEIKSEQLRVNIFLFLKKHKKTTSKNAAHHHCASLLSFTRSHSSPSLSSFTFVLQIQSIAAAFNFQCSTYVYCKLRICTHTFNTLLRYKVQTATLCKQLLLYNLYLSVSWHPTHRGMFSQQYAPLDFQTFLSQVPQNCFSINKFCFNTNVLLVNTYSQRQFNFKGNLKKPTQN